MHELEDFINPSPNKSSDHQSLIKKLKKIESVPDSISEDIDEIGEYCVKLIGDLNK
jgi:hypothetical protein